MKIPPLALILALATLTAGPIDARAGAGPAWQSVSGPSGFLLQVPSGWSTSAPAGAGTSLKETIASTDDQEHVSVYVSPLQIPLSELPLFVSTYLGNKALGSPALGQPQAATVPGSAAAETSTGTYTDASGRRVADTVLAAATASQLYVLEIVTPADYAQENATQIQAIVQSFAIGSS